jgi:hypothetical protein
MVTGGVRTVAGPAGETVRALRADVVAKPAFVVAATAPAVSGFGITTATGLGNTGRRGADRSIDAPGNPDVASALDGSAGSYALAAAALKTAAAAAHICVILRTLFIEILLLE